ncbi:MAG TPA: hypothetical protein VF940_31605 [Streptosporangiaceae bacterium]
MAEQDHLRARLLNVCSDAAVPLVAKHTRNANPCLLLYNALGIGEPEVPRTKPTCCGPEGQPPIDPDLAAPFEEGLRRLA